jgi:uncharacterized protein YjiS (DUF1127 family)
MTKMAAKTFQPATAELPRRIFQVIGETLRRMRRAYRLERTSRALHRLDDRQLRDIGLTRDSIDEAIRSHGDDL